MGSYPEVLARAAVFFVACFAVAQCVRMLAQLRAEREDAGDE